jgi:hypothetical protein
MTRENSLPPCERFAVLESRTIETSRCDVCDQLEAAHHSPGRRVLSGAEIEALRRRMIVETYEALEEERRHSEGST